MGLFELSLALLFFVIFAMFLNQKPFLNNDMVSTEFGGLPKVGIEKNVFVESPTHEDIVDLIKNIEEYNNFIKEDELVDDNMDVEFRYILENLKFKI